MSNMYENDHYLTQARSEPMSDPVKLLIGH